MYQDMMKDVQEKMKPFNDAVEINKATAEKLVALHTEYVSDLFNSGVNQMKALTEVKAPKDALELQMSYFKELDAKLTNVAEQEIAAMVEAKEKLTVLAEQSMSDLSEAPALQEVTQMFQAAQAKVQETTEAMTAAAKPAAKPAAKTARKASAA